VIWIAALVVMIPALTFAYLMGVRTERGRHARWAAVQEAVKEDRRRAGGIVLKKLRVVR
jgi:hypothetical protein